VCDWLLPCNVSDAPIGTDNPEGGGCRRFEVKDVILKRSEWNQVSGMFKCVDVPVACCPGFRCPSKPDI
jgi:hypothetical protein